MTNKCPTRKSLHNDLTDFSQGDPEAANANKGPENRHEEKEIDFFKASGKLSENSDDSEQSNDTTLWNYNEQSGHLKSSPFLHIRTCSKQSVAQLRQESKSILSLKTSPLSPKGSGSVNSTSPTDINKNSTIFELCWEDRQRVGQLIEELASSQENLDVLQAYLKNSEKAEIKYKHKTSDLMKKLDVMGEKIHRQETEKALMKQKHLESLTILQNKIATISDQFEASAQEIQKLRLDKEELKLEGKEIRSKAASLEVKVKTAEVTKMETDLFLEAANKREKTFKKQIKELLANVEELRQEEKVRKQIVKKLENQLKLQAKQLEKKESRNPRSKKASPLLHYDDNMELLEPGRPIVTTTSDHSHDNEDAILQEIFFRF